MWLRPLSQSYQISIYIYYNQLHTYIYWEEGSQRVFVSRSFIITFAIRD